MKDQLSTLRIQFQSELSATQASKDVEQLKVKYLGKKGSIQELMQHLRNTPAEERPAVGQQINTLKEEITHLCDQALHSFSQAELAKRLGEEKIDISLPGRKSYLGKAHPLSHMMEKLSKFSSAWVFPCNTALISTATITITKD